MYTGMPGVTRTLRQRQHDVQHDVQLPPPCSCTRHREPFGTSTGSAGQHPQQRTARAWVKAVLSVIVGDEAERLAVRGHCKGLVLMQEEMRKRARHRDGSASALQRDNNPMQRTASTYWRKTRRVGGG